MPTDFNSQVKKILHSISSYTLLGSGLTLRSYQQGPCAAIIDSIRNNSGLSFVVIFPRQSGKNEIQAQLQAYLLTIFSQNISPSELVAVSPTWKPQCENAMFRLESALSRSLVSRWIWTKSRGYIYQVGSSRIYFLSGSPSTSIVGTTASTLLIVDEAQDILTDKFDKDIAPMAASTNATRVFFGTAWTSNTLLSREEQAAKILEKADGIQRVWRISCDSVSSEVPSYKAFVSEQVSKLGRNHPMVKTQYFSEDIDAAGGLFPDDRVQCLYGNHSPQIEPLPGAIYVSALDVAGENENGMGLTSGPSRDATVITIAQVDLSSLLNSSNHLPTYRIVSRIAWFGVKHTELYSDILDLSYTWNFKFLICDATGIGTGLASFLARSLGPRVIPFVFSSKSKSDLAWSFLSLIDSGRLKDYSITADLPSHFEDFQKLFYSQLQHCQYEIHPGPEKRISWGVPTGTRDVSTGDSVHDDFLFSAAMISILDGKSWSLPGPTAIVQASDPLDDMKGF